MVRVHLLPSSFVSIRSSGAGRAVKLSEPFRADWNSRYQDQALWQRPGWKPLHWALGFTCICFLVRSFYRTVELSQG